MPATLWRMRHLLIALLFVCFAHAQEPADDKSTLDGTVRNSVTQLPVGKASIHLIPIAGRAGYIGATGASGTFSFEGIAPGDYRMLVEKGGYSSGSLTLSFTAGKKVTGVDLALAPFGSISGTVTGLDEAPLAGVPLQLITQQWQRGRHVYRAVDSTESGDDGTYRFEAPPGRYYVHASRPGGAGPLAGTFREGPGKPELALTGGYFPEVTDWDGRAPVQVFSGIAVTRIDFALHLSPVFHVRGKRNPDKLHDGSSSFNVFLRKKAGDQAAGWDGVGSSSVKPDGSFDIAGVPPGEYFLGGLRRGYEGTMTFDESARGPLTVGSRDLNGVGAEALRWFSLSGRIQGAGPNTYVGFEALSAPRDFVTHPVGREPDGTFSLGNLTSDRYTIRVSGAAYLKAIRYKGVELQQAEIDLTASGGDDLELVLSDGVGQVEGTVTLPEGKSGDDKVRSPAEIHAVLVPEKAPLGDTRPLSADVNQERHFSFANVPPGSYRAFAVEAYDSGLWESTEFLGQIADRGIAVDVPEKSTAHVEMGLLTSRELRLVEERIP